MDNFPLDTQTPFLFLALEFVKEGGDLVADSVSKRDRAF